MSVAKVTEIIASSTVSIEDAVKTGLARANETLSGIQSAWVKDIKCTVDDGNVAEWRVIMHVTFLLND